MSKKVGTLIREARTNAGMTQAQLAKKVDGATASDISRAERGEKELTQAMLKQIAKATGVTQASLLNAAKKSSSSGKTGSSKPSSSSASSSLKLSASEKKLVELYRKADTATKKKVMDLLKGKKSESEDMLNSLIDTAVDLLSKK